MMILDDVQSQFGITETVNTSQFFSYYPKYEYLDTMLGATQKKHINLFVDVKGCAPALYLEWGVRTILDYSKTHRHISVHLFSAILQFIAFHKLYAAKRGITISFYFFMEQGKSKYHLNIYNGYKENRNISDFFNLDMEDKELLAKLLDKNYDISEYVINRIPKCYFYKLQFCEADFIPWYLMKYKIPKITVDESLNLIYSRDKDMHQCLGFPNTYQYYRANYRDSSCLINEDNCFEHWFKTPCRKADRAADWFPLFLSMVGDAADGIPGIKGIGAKTIIKFLDDIFNVYGNDPDIMYQQCMSGSPVLFESQISLKNKTADKLFKNEKIIQRNMKLISYRALSEYVNGDSYTLDAIDIKKYIDKVCNNNEKLRNYNTLFESMKSKGLDDMIDEKTCETCFL